MLINLKRIISHENPTRWTNWWWW